jgi:DNA-binding beta-propeller fold protein YncE/peroxiredoxin
LPGYQAGAIKKMGDQYAHRPSSSMLVLCFLFFSVFAHAGDRSFSPAPEFPVDLPWFNVPEPLSLRQLRGKVVVLDFWTYGCINCLHVADELKVLEEQFGSSLVVISVHSPKFDNERDLETLKRNVIRYDLRHPVVQDEDFHLMQAYGARAWPTLAVIDPEGRYVARLVGENVQDRLEKIIDFLLLKHAEDINPDPIPLALLQGVRNTTGLAGPGKVAAGDGIVAVSDTLNHRVVIADQSGEVMFVYGGEEGFNDGARAEARFRSPQGVLVDGGRVYVADAGNHAVRMIDIANNTVSTLAGTGQVGRRLDFAAAANARGVDLRSPWALALNGASLYIAMAGSHQVWVLDLSTGRLSVFAGTGREGIDDGPARQATFSQPSGLALAGRALFVVDAEASALRRIDLETARVDTLVGTGLFDFGDRDGPFELAQLQHPGGVAVLGDGDLLIADTYNHKLRRVDLSERRVTTVAGSGEPGPGTGAGEDSLLNEPSGVAVSGGLVLVADTNNDRLLRYDAAGGGLTEWKLEWAPADDPAPQSPGR